MSPLPLPLAQFRVPPDLIGPAIFAVIFLGTWIWNGYQKAVKRREVKRRAEEEAGERPPSRVDERVEAGSGRRGRPPTRAASDFEPSRSVAAVAGSSSAAGPRPGMSMRERIEAARAQAAAGGGGNPGTRPSSRQAQPRPLRPAFAGAGASPRPLQRPEAAKPPVPRRPPPRPVAPTREQPRAASPSLSETKRPIEVQGLGAEAAGPVRLRFDRESARRAIVMMEVLGPPVSLRDRDGR